ncbi:transcriptional repressor LexA [Streptomyces sp. NPDC005953]|uniref:transcriptional repressor LexA n=1 Tax=Streptomyces sp. NPDC005953 TaxID=3156719 RepID=UPI0033D26222
MRAVHTVAGPGRPPGAGSGSPSLTTRQALIVDFIEREVARQGYPPSMREIGRAVDLKSTSSVAHQLMALERKGVLYRDPHRPRAYRVRYRWGDDFPQAATAGTPEMVLVPLVGRIAAGVPVLAEEHSEEVLPLPRHLVGRGDLFALKVVGDSMIDAAICEGDTVAVRRQAAADHGDIVASLGRTVASRVSVVIGAARRLLGRP